MVVEVEQRRVAEPCPAREATVASAPETSATVVVEQAVLTADDGLHQRRRREGHRSWLWLRRLIERGSLPLARSGRPCRDWPSQSSGHPIESFRVSCKLWVVIALVLLVCLKRMATHVVVGITVVSAAESAWQEIARLWREVVDMWAGQRDMELEREELRKAAEGKTLRITAHVYLGSGRYVIDETYC